MSETDDKPIVFNVGQLVKLSSHAIEIGIQGRAKTIFGTVMRLWINPSGNIGIIWVKRNGLKTPCAYSPVFWENAKA